MYLRDLKLNPQKSHIVVMIHLLYCELFLFHFFPETANALFTFLAIKQPLSDLTSNPYFRKKTQPRETPLGCSVRQSQNSEVCKDNWCKCGSTHGYCV